MLLTPQLTTLNELYGDVTIPADVTEGAGGTAAGAQTATTATGTTAVAAPLVKALTGLTLQTDDPLKRTACACAAAGSSECTCGASLALPGGFASPTTAGSSFSSSSKLKSLTPQGEKKMVMSWGMTAVTPEQPTTTAAV
eukprot:17589-Heterococcus_DN1.PRE.1